MTQEYPQKKKSQRKQPKKRNNTHLSSNSEVDILLQQATQEPEAPLSFLIPTQIDHEAEENIDQYYQEWEEWLQDRQRRI